MSSRARSLWRRARTLPVLRAVLSTADRLWWARTIRAADIVDEAFVAAQTGRRLSPRAAVRHYVRGGFRTGLSLNPLYLERTVSRQLPDADRVPALYAYLVNDRSRLQVSPAWDAPALAERHPESLEDPAGPLGFAWRRARRDGWMLLGPADAPARILWSEIVRVTGAPLPTRPAAPATEPTLVCVLGRREPDADLALDLAATAATEFEMAVDLVVTGTSFTEGAHAALLHIALPRLTARRAPGEEPLTPADRAGAPLTAFRAAGATITAPRLRVLVEAARSGPVEALWVTPDGTVASLGAAWHDGRPVPVLRDHPVEDARRLGTAVAVPLLRGPVRAWPAGTSPDGPGRVLTTATATASVRSWRPADAPNAPPADTDLDALLRPAGFAVDAWTDDAARLRRIPRPGEDAMRRRWAIKTAAPAGVSGEAWGDTHFARGLAAALERAGQEAVVDALPAADRATSGLDDVVLVLRGPERLTPPAAGRHLLWIISHPDEITAEELAPYDRVFAASEPWARSASMRFGRLIEPLLQCTDTRRFHPSGATRTEEIVFVGTARGIARPVVVEPLRAGVPVQVYGPDWRGYIPAAAIVATGIPNDRLPALYERAAVVLNDHWPAMQREGFISNRLYDVVAAGGRAVSDEVAGIEDAFSGAVVTYASPAELVDLLSGELDSRFPDEATLSTISLRVRECDSFDARARTLIAAASAGQADSTAASPAARRSSGNTQRS